MEQQLTIRLPGDLFNKVRTKAKNMGLKRSDVVRLALTEYVQEPGETRPIYERVKHLIGSVNTGIPDLGVRHRHYIIQKLKRQRRG